MSRRVAILGATGLVGQTMLRILEQREFPLASVRLLATGASAGRELWFRGRAVPVEPVGARSFDGVEIALFAVANPVSQEWEPAARAAGARVIDNSSAFRYHDQVPLVVPEINRERLDSRPTLVANPNCSTIAIVMALAPLARAARLERVAVATYQSVSGAGAEALAELERGVREGLDHAPPPRDGGLPPFAFNVVPHIDRFEENGYTREEMKIVWESRKILGMPDLKVNVTAVRVPVFYGHAEAVHLETRRKLGAAEARALLAKAPGVVVVDDRVPGGYPTPATEAAHHDGVFVGRIREDLSHDRGLDLWVVADNIRKGAALNAVQVAELLVKDYL